MSSYRFRTPNGKRLHQLSRKYDKTLAKINLMALDPDTDIPMLRAFEELIGKVERVFDEKIEPLAAKKKRRA